MRVSFYSNIPDHFYLQAVELEALEVAKREVEEEDARVPGNSINSTYFNY